MSRKRSGKRRNCLLRAISPFHKCFQKTCTANTYNQWLVLERVKPDSNQLSLIQFGSWIPYICEAPTSSIDLTGSVSNHPTKIIFEKKKNVGDRECAFLFAFSWNLFF